MTRNDVRELLSKIASDAPDLSGLARAPELQRRIARRRRLMATGILVVGFGVGGLALGLGSLAGSGGSPPAGQSTAGPDRSLERPGAGQTHMPSGCGTRIESSPPGAPLKLTTGVPVQLLPNEHGQAEVRITLVNASGSSVEGLAGVSPAVLLTRNGIVVATSGDIPAAGLITKLGAGQTREFTSTLDVKACASGSAGPLEPGEYQFFARLGFQFRDTAGTSVGESIDIWGGPWAAVLH